MKKFTLYFVLVALAMPVAGQSRTFFQLPGEENREILVKLVGESRAKTLERVLSHPFPLQREILTKSVNEYTLKLDSTVTKIAPNTWGRDMKEEYLYDAALRPSVIIEEYLGSEGWQQMGITKMRYNDQGQLSTVLMLIVDHNTRVEDSVLMESFYNTLGRLDSVLAFEVMNGQTWEHSMRQFFTYNDSGLLAEMSMVVFDNSAEAWRELMSHRYTYNEASKKLYYSVYYSDEEGDLLNSETLYFYDNVGRLTHKETSTLNLATLKLQKSEKIEYVQGAGNDISSQVIYHWASENWWEWFRIEFFYNGFIDYSDAVFPRNTFAPVYGTADVDISFTKLLIEAREIGQLDWDNIIRYYYSSTTSTSAHTPVPESAGLFPNPATSHIFISWPDNHEQRMLEVYQINGAMVMQQAVRAGSSVSVDHLNRGLYFYRLTGNGHIHASGKILLQ